MWNRKYRIITGKFRGYIIKRRDIWFPFWYQIGLDYYPDIKSAEDDIAMFMHYAKRISKQKKIVREYKY